MDELVSAAGHRRKCEVEAMLAHRFPPQAPAAATLTPIRSAPVRVLAPGQVEIHAPSQAESPEAAAPPSASADSSCEAFVLRVTIDRGLRDKIRSAQALLSHAVPSGDVAQVLDRALDALIGQLEKRKFGACAKPRPRPSTTTRRRHVPAHVRRAVWVRDGGHCTFIGDTGHRCGERKRIELDHVDPVARGGTATVDGLRLRCHAHNQYEAERALGREFMERKRAEARRAEQERRGRAAVAEQERREQVAEATRLPAAAAEHTAQILSGLRGLGFNVAEARLGAEHARTLQGASLEERMCAALQFLCPRPPRAAAWNSA